MNRVEQKEAVIAALRRRDQIAEETRSRLSELDRRGDDILAHVDLDVRTEAEEEYSASIGRKRYVTSDGRVLFLTPEEISHRRRAKARNAAKREHQPDAVSDQLRRRRLVVLAFNAGVVLLAVAIGLLLLR